ncbi:MAG: ribosomal protein S18 acetylase RimI-like enzyme [Paraglaciecola sp.]|jgi:ribosomal protein S18 acetylase RimI-like enzyme
MDYLAPLLLCSAPRVLPLLFDYLPSCTATGYLRHALSWSNGQFGYGNHWVLAQGKQVVASGCNWGHELPEGFVSGTFDSLVSYYSQAQLLTVLQRCQVLQGVFPKPQAHELCVGHIAVNALHRRQGLASQLLDHFQAMGKELGKTALTLDVESSNQAAIDCYLKYGFVHTSSHNDDSELSLGYYHHLRKVL